MEQKTDWRAYDIEFRTDAFLEDESFIEAFCEGCEHYGEFCTFWEDECEKSDEIKNCIEVAQKASEALVSIIKGFYVTVKLC